jgi:hypothetical protein
MTDLLVGATAETVSKLGVKSELCHDLASHLFCLPHPNPLPEGEGASQERFLPFPLPLGEGYRVRAFVLRLQQQHGF